MSNSALIWRYQNWHQHHARRHSVLSLSLYDTPGRAPHMKVLFLGPGDFPVRYSNRDTSWNASNRHSASFMDNTGILFSNMNSPSHECQMTFWPLTSYSDFPTDRTFHQFHDLDTGLDLRRITSGFHGAFATGKGTLTLPDTWFRPPPPPLGVLLMLQLLRPFLPNLPYLFSTFCLITPRYFLNFALYRYYIGQIATQKTSTTNRISAVFAVVLLLLSLVVV